MIKSVRKSFNLTQNQLADIICCSPKEIYRAEKNLCGLNYYLIRKLSRVLNFDFISYSNSIETFGSTETFELFFRLKNAILYNEKEKVKDAVFDIERTFNSKQKFDQNTFEDVEAYQMYIYGKSFSETDQNVIIEMLLQALNITDFYKDTNNILSKRLCDTEYKILSALSGYLGLVKKYDEALMLLENLLLNLQKFVYNSNYEFYVVNKNKIRTTIVVYNNLANLLFLLGQCKKALHICNEGIAFCLKYHSNEFLCYLYTLKFEILFALGKHDEAKAMCYDTITLCKMIGENDYIKVIESKIDKNYKSFLD